MTVAAWDGQPFSASKLALFYGPHLCVTLRDMKPDIPYPGMWDMPGGARDPGESPVDCVLRETREEIGVSLTEDALAWGHGFDNRGRLSWLFLARLEMVQIGSLRFGDEGVGWTLFSVEDFLNHPKAVPQLQTGSVSHWSVFPLHKLSAENGPKVTVFHRVIAKQCVAICVFPCYV